MKLLTIATVVVVIACGAYVATYFSSPASVQVLQTDLHGFRFEMLHAKQPILVDDNVADMDELRRHWFAHNITSLSVLAGSDAWHRNHHKYCVLRARQAGDIYLSVPGSPSTADGSAPDPLLTSLTAIPLQPGQLLVVPFRWRYLVSPGVEADLLGVHDLVTVLL